MTGLLFLASDKYGASPSYCTFSSWNDSISGGMQVQTRYKLVEALYYITPYKVSLGVRTDFEPIVLASHCCFEVDFS